jgi:hypothetical protein
MRSILALAMLAVCLVSKADQPLTITDTGYWLTYVDATGAPTYRKIEDVRDLRGGVVNPPSDQPSPPTPPPAPPALELDMSLVKDVEAWAESVGDPITSQAIAFVYEIIAGALEGDLIAPADAWAVLRESTNEAIKVGDGNKDWKPFRSQLSDVVTKGQQLGELAQKQSAIRLIHSVRQGLEDSAQDAVAISLDKQAKIAWFTVNLIQTKK